MGAGEQTLFLERDKQQILEAWERDARALPGWSKRAAPVLLDTILQFLDELAAWTASEAADLEEHRRRLLRLADVHAEARLQQSVDLAEVVEEYRLLRTHVLQAALAEERRVHGEPDTGPNARRVVELARLNEGLDLAISEAVLRFAQRRQQHLEMTEERLRLALSSAEIGTWDYDAASQILELDAKGRDILGLSPDEPIGYGLFFSEALHPNDRARVEAALEAALRGEGGGAYHAEYRVPDFKTRTLTWVDARGRVFFDPDGKPARFVGTIHDVTVKNRLEETREQFIGILGHDLRSPLSAISLSAKVLLRSESLAPELLAAARRISNSAERMSRLVSQVLDFARARLGGGIPVTLSRSDFDEVVRAVVEEIRTAHPRRSIQLRPHGDLVGDFDRDRLAQAIANLLVNAIEHGDDPIRLVTCGDDERVIVEVSNRGAAIPPDELGRIFEPFRSAKTTKRAPRMGARLGLYIVSEVVRAHRGRISVRSSEQQGTAFTVELPRWMN